MTEFVRTHDTDDRRPATGYENACAPDHDRVRSPGGERDSWVNGQVVGLAPAVSLAFNMISQAATISRDQLAYSNQGQLNAIGAMVQLVQQCARPPSRDDAPTFKEALDLAMQVVAVARKS